jgi:hypothetical protein
MKKDIQIRGNCQCCAREQAVVGGLMSKHGYTVEHGWFQGVCSGNHYQPMQVSRVETDRIVSEIRAEIPKLLALSDQYESGYIKPESVTKRVLDVELRKWVDVKIAFAEATLLEQSRAVDQIVWGLRNKARSGKDFANQLESIADKVHGKPLIEVAKKEVIPIRVGDKKLSKESGSVFTCFKVDGARVYWSATRASDGKEMRSWMGSQAWRKLETV